MTKVMSFGFQETLTYRWDNPADFQNIVPSQIVFSLMKPVLLHFSQLETSKVTASDIVHLRYYFEYQWLVDFALYAATVFTISEVKHFNFRIVPIFCW